MTIVNGVLFGGRRPKITIEQYRKILEVKNSKGSKYGRYKILQRELGIPQSTLSSAVKRGVKIYDYFIEKEYSESERIREAIESEREACAKVCEELRDSFASPRYATGQPMSSIRERFAAGRCAEVIRERSRT